VNILVPPDIVPVKRVSPIKVKKRTVWRERPEGERIERGREWMTDNLFVADSYTSQLERLVPASFTVHLIAAIVVVLIVGFTQAHRVPRLVKVTAPLVMPAMLSFVPIAEVPRSQATTKASAPSPPKPVPQPPAAAPPPVSSHEDASSSLPLEAPSTIAPDEASDDGPHGVSGVEGGVAGGTVGGVAGGVVGGEVGGEAVPVVRSRPSGPVRLRAGIDPPRKIKDVRPTYPAFALAGFKRGTVIIEATIGVDGKVQEATVVRSVPALDRAALDAVRQWEYMPARMDGEPIAVIMMVVVQFAIA
jgi:protein TonB